MIWRELQRTGLKQSSIINYMGLKLLYDSTTESGFETCFGWAPGTMLGSDSKNTSRIQMLLAGHFDL